MADDFQILENFSHPLKVRSVDHHRMELDGDFDDAPPLLVIEDGIPPVGAPDGLEAGLEELNITKVPITVVTGEFEGSTFSELAYIFIPEIDSAYLI